MVEIDEASTVILNIDTLCKHLPFVYIRHLSISVLERILSSVSLHEKKYSLPKYVRQGRQIQSLHFMSHWGMDSALYLANQILVRDFGS